VSISWSVIPDGKDHVLKFQWQERGGPVVSAPTREGFGTALLKDTFDEARIDYAPEGLRCEIDVPLVNFQPDTTDPPTAGAPHAQA